MGTDEPGNGKRPRFASRTSIRLATNPGLNDDRIDLARALASLDSGWSEVITLRFIHGLSAQETAEVLGITVDAVKGKQARALAELRKKLHLDTSFS